MNGKLLLPPGVSSPYLRLAYFYRCSFWLMKKYYGLPESTDFRQVFLSSAAPENACPLILIISILTIQVSIIGLQELIF